MKSMPFILVVAFLLTVAVVEAKGDDAKPVENALPKSIAVKEIMALLEKQPVAGQGLWGMYMEG